MQNKKKLKLLIIIMFDILLNHYRNNKLSILKIAKFLPNNLEMYETN